MLYIILLYILKVGSYYNLVSESFSVTNMPFYLRVKVKRKVASSPTPRIATTKQGKNGP